MICFIAEEENFKTLFLNYNSNFFSELPFTQILKLCFTFSTNEKMTELSIKACVTFSIFLRPCLLSDDVLKMKTVGVFNKRSTNCCKKETESKQWILAHAFGTSDILLQFKWQSFWSIETVMSWGSQKKKECILCNTDFL